jgi:hypothetical protein
MLAVLSVNSRNGVEAGTLELQDIGLVDAW